MAVYRHAIGIREDQLREAIRVLAVHRAIGLFQHRWQVTELWNAMISDPPQQPIPCCVPCSARPDATWVPGRASFL